MLDRLRDPTLRQRIASEMRVSSPGWENLYLLAGADGTRIKSVVAPGLRPLVGRTIAAIAAERGVEPEIAVLDIVLRRAEEAIQLLLTKKARGQWGNPGR